MAKPKKVDPIKQREKRAKIAAAVGGVLFLVVAAIEIPSMMSALNKKPPPGANATDAGNRNPDGSIPLPNVAVSAGLSGNGQLADTDVPPQSTAGQLVSFSVFQTKNPFVPQVTDSGTSSSAPAAPPSTADKGGADVPPPTATTPAVTTPTPTPTATTPTTTTSMVPPTATVPSTTTPTAAPQPSVTIKVNGTASRVAAEGTFPSRAPVFRLVSFTSDSAQIAIVGGSYATGDATLTLHLGQPVTLENQTDGKRYTLELVATH